MAWWSDPWLLAIVVLLATSVLSVLAWLHIRFWERALSFPLHYDSVEVHRAPDGGRFELRHLTAPLTPDSHLGRLPPVLLVHGICANHRNQDACEQSSLARYLASQGRDVWLATLRSGRPWRAKEGLQPARFASMARFDVPMAVARVLELTHEKQLDYVGFSMGGMLLYASVGRGVKPQQLRRAVFVGAPGRVQPPIGVPRLLRFLPAVLVPPILTGLLGTAFAFMSEWVVTPAHRVIVNPRNLAPGATRQALVDVVQDVPGRLLADFMVWATSDGVIRVDGQDVLQG
ncbi:MAG: alpha/beta hydrolase, partial [Polyangiaceae bacterium]|nr:alpha/beta hydrolase [Polyangiaceae bacterium]